MKYSLVYFFILFSILANIAKAEFEEHCNISCGIDKPVMCRRRREKCQPTAACRNTKNTYPISMEQKHLIIHLHNKLRNQMAMGLYNDLKATDMLELTWNNELEDMAVCWANSCQVKLDPCIKTLDNQEVGQNVILLNSKQLSRGLIVGLQVGLQLWFNERNLAHLGAAQINSYSGYNTRATNDFTRAIWAKTRFVGCGRAYTGSWGNKLFLVCNYVPAGNIPGEKIYTRGDKPCSQCPKIDKQEGECSHVWPSLCKTANIKTGILYEKFEDTSKGTGRLGAASIFVIVVYLLPNVHISIIL